MGPSSMKNGSCVCKVIVSHTKALFAHEVRASRIIRLFAKHTTTHIVIYLHLV